MKQSRINYTNEEFIIDSGKVINGTNTFNPKLELIKQLLPTILGADYNLYYLHEYKKIKTRILAEYYGYSHDVVRTKISRARKKIEKFTEEVNSAKDKMDDLIYDELKLRQMQSAEDNNDE